MGSESKATYFLNITRVEVARSIRFVIDKILG